jgi:putative transposase
MSRLPRLYVPEIPSHVTVRGNDRQDIFHCDGDRLRFRALLLEAAERHRLAVHAYVFMSNHVHLLATGAHVLSIAKSLQSVGRRYVAYFNGRYGRSGTLWEGRYKAALVDTDGYLLACHRYIDLNPVRGGLVADPSDYSWSSNRCYAWGQADDLVTPHPLVGSLGAGDGDRSAAYRALFTQPLQDAVLQRIRFCSNHGWALGSPEFCKTLESYGGRRASPLPMGWRKGRRRRSGQ